MRYVLVWAVQKWGSLFDMYYLVDKKNGKTNENVDPKIVQFKYINLLLRNLTKPYKILLKNI